MFDNPLNILVLVILVAGWAMLLYLVVTLIKPRGKKGSESASQRVRGGEGMVVGHRPQAIGGESRILDIEPGSKQPVASSVQHSASSRSKEEPTVLNPQWGGNMGSSGTAKGNVATNYAQTDGVLLSIEVPKENETTPLAAELMFSSLHGIYKPELDKLKSGLQDAISFEIQAQEKAIRFFVWVPRYLQGYVEGQIYAQYQGVNIQEVKDYASQSKLSPDIVLASAELVLNKEDIFPIKSFESFEVDPLAAITSTLSKLTDPAQIWVQMIIRPENDSWRNRAIKYIDAVKTGKTSFSTSLVKGLRGLASDVMSTAFTGAAPSAPEAKPAVQLAPGVEDALKQIETKSTKLGFQTKIRIVAADKTFEEAKQKLDLVVGSFKQFNTTNLNGFVAAPVTGTPNQVLSAYSAREFSTSGPVLNVLELASIYHLPSNTVSTPHIVWAGSKKGEPPANLPLVEEIAPEEITSLGVTNFRGSQEIFGIKIPDRRRHIYVIGKSGVGKSTLLQNMTLDDIKEGRGVGVIDPHGDYVDYVLDRIPENRLNDVIVFDPSDRDFPVGFNILHVENPKYKVIAASGVVSVFKKIFGESWGPRLEYWLSSAVLALLDYPGATLMMLPRLFTDDAFRMDVIEKINDPVIKARWIGEYNTLDQRQRAETISPILNKVGQFLSSSLVRNIIAQPENGFNLREVLDSKKILLVKLAKGLIGEDNAALLGAMLVTQIQLAAMSRADELDQEKRADFFLYVDEFQNFATDSFAVILSEARKYRLSLTLAHQFMAQLPETVTNAVIGNVGTIVSFRVGANDAAFLMKEFAPVFDEQDLVNLNVFNIYLKLSVDGLTAGAFSAATLPPEAGITSNKEGVLNASRKKYSKNLDDVLKQVTSQTEAITGGGDSRGGQIRPNYGYGQRGGGGQWPGNSGQRQQGGGQGQQAGRGIPNQQINKSANGGGEQANSPQPRVDSGQQVGRSAGQSSQGQQATTGGQTGGIQPQVRRGPNVDALKNLLSGIQKKTPTPLAPDQRNELAKTLMDDLNGGAGNSFKSAFEKAKEEKSEIRNEKLETNGEKSEISNSDGVVIPPPAPAPKLTGEIARDVSSVQSSVVSREGQGAINAGRQEELDPEIKEFLDSQTGL
jgi:hypothetical protein